MRDGLLSLSLSYLNRFKRLTETAEIKLADLHFSVKHVEIRERIWRTQLRIFAVDQNQVNHFVLKKRKKRVTLIIGRLFFFYFFYFLCAKVSVLRVFWRIFHRALHVHEERNVCVRELENFIKLSSYTSSETQRQVLSDSASSANYVRSLTCEFSEQV